MRGGGGRAVRRIVAVRRHLRVLSLGHVLDLVLVRRRQDGGLAVLYIGGHLTAACTSVLTNQAMFVSQVTTGINV